MIAKDAGDTANVTDRLVGFLDGHEAHRRSSDSPSPNRLAVHSAEGQVYATGRGGIGGEANASAISSSFDASASLWLVARRARTCLASRHRVRSRGAELS